METTRSFLTLPEVARRADLSRATLYRMLKGGNGPRVTKLGRLARVTVEAEAEWRQALDGQRVAIAAASATA